MDEEYDFYGNKIEHNDNNSQNGHNPANNTQNGYNTVNSNVKNSYNTQNAYKPTNTTMKNNYNNQTYDQFEKEFNSGSSNDNMKRLNRQDPEVKSFDSTLFFTGIILSIIGAAVIKLILGFSESSVTPTVEGILEYISKMKTYVTLNLVFQFFVVIIATRISIMIMEKNISINSDNIDAIMQTVKKTLLVLLAIIIMNSFSNLSDVKENGKKIDKFINMAETLVVTDEEQKLVDEMSGLVDYASKMIVIQMVVYAAGVGASIYLARVWLTQKAKESGM